MPRNDAKELMLADLERVRARDPELARELDERRGREGRSAYVERLSSGLKSLTSDPAGWAGIGADYRTAHPVFTVLDNQLGPSQPHLESQVWRGRLDAAGERLLRAIRAVGRIVVDGQSEGPFFGTGFLVREDVIATNAHVAQAFAAPSRVGAGFDVLGDFGGKMPVSIDFLGEDGRSDTFVVPVLDVLYVEMDQFPDLALLTVDRTGRERFPEPLALSPVPPRPGQRVAAVGYPTHEIRLRYAELMRQIFGDVYDKKRVAPGEVSGIEAGHVLHDCSVLGGNSGSPLIDLETGQVVGIHHTGEFLAENRAVPAGEAEALLDRVMAGDVLEGGDQPQPGFLPAARERITVVPPAGGEGGVVVRIEIPIHLEITLQAPGRQVE